MSFGGVFIFDGTEYRWLGGPGPLYGAVLPDPATVDDRTFFVVPAEGVYQQQGGSWVAIGALQDDLDTLQGEIDALGTGMVPGGNDSKVVVVKADGSDFDMEFITDANVSGILKQKMAVTFGVATLVGAANQTDFYMPIPWNMIATSMYATIVGVPGSTAIQLRKYVGGVWSDVAGFAIASWASNLGSISPTPVNLDAGTILGATIATPSGTNLVVSVIGTSR